MSIKNSNPPAISFGRDQWESVTGLPLTVCNEMVACGLIRSLKIGKRRIFLHADVMGMFEKLAKSGKVLVPRTAAEQLRETLPPVERARRKQITKAAREYNSSNSYAAMRGRRS